MSIKSYLDLSGLSHFHDMAIADKISATQFYEPCGSAEVASETYTTSNSPYYSKSGDTYTRVAVTKGTAVAGYYHLKAANTAETKVAPSIKASVDYLDNVIETIVAPAIDTKISTVGYGTVTISGSSFTGIYTVNGTTKSVVAVDNTAGGTTTSTSLITSGAVNEGLASINAVKIGKNIFTTKGDIIYATAADTPSRLGIGTAGQVLTVVNDVPTWADASGGGLVDDVKVDGTSVVTNKVANIDLTGKADKATTLAGYGITDAKIASGVITLGANTITPITDVSGKVDKTTTVNGHALSANVTVTKGDVGLGNVENKSSATIRGEITSSNVTTALGFTPMNAALKGANNGVAELGSDGKVPSAQLPSYVDDVIEVETYADLPATGEAGKIYVVKDTNKTYRWTGTTYVEISASLALGETSSTAYRGDRGAAAYAHGVTNKGSAFASNLYKITTNSEGHVTAAAAVVKADITALGIPAQDTITTATTTGSGNAVTSITASNGALTVTKGTTFLTSHQDITGKVDKSTLTAKGDIYYASAASTPARLGIGSSGQVLTVSNGVPTWVTPAAGGVTDVTLNGTSVVSSGVASFTADTAAGGTYQSSSLITSGAVNAGLAAIDDMKCEKINSYSITLAAASWSGSASPYSQAVSVTGTTAKSKIDIQADSTALAQMISDKTNAIYIANNNGTLTAYAVGTKPTANLAVQVTRTELA